MAVCVLLAATIAVPARGSIHQSALTIILDFRDPYSERSIAEMKRETEQILGASGLHLGWQSSKEASSSTYDDLVVVRFSGVCRANPLPHVYDELGPLAFTYSTDGAMQPFSEVSCNKVAALVRSAMWGHDFKASDLLFGRALGRVLAHELVHILTKSPHHAHEGVQRAALSGQQLIQPALPLSPADLAMLRESVATRP